MIVIHMFPRTSNPFNNVFADIADNEIAEEVQGRRKRLSEKIY
jgi:hypothetical protein